MAGYIRYETKNGKEYASVYRARRVDGKKINDVEWLGKVIDKEKGIYQSRNKGIYQFTLENGVVAYLPSVQEKLILDYGDSFLLHKVLINTGFVELCRQVFRDLKLYKNLVDEHKSDLENAKHLVKYRERFVYIKRVQITLYGEPGYAYIGSDIDRKHEEVKKYINRTFDDEDVSFDDMDTAIRSKGIFILVSSNEICTSDILPLYYTRQAIEQVFDIGKNNADLLPLRVHGVDKFRGHLLISFLASAAYILLNNELSNSNFCAIGAYRLLRNLKCKVYDDKIIVQEANKKMHDIAKHMKFDFPTVVNF